MTVVLWDVDGTLVRAGPAGRLAFADAVAAVFGTAIEHDDLPRMAGKTDRQIALEVLSGMGQPDHHLPAVEAAIEAALLARAGQVRTEGIVLPGVRALIDALDAAGVTQTLVTGNIAPNARLKLEAVGLHPGALRLELGAYGSDDGDRDNLVPIALARCRAAGVAASPGNAWVVGDTPRDLACARAAGVRCLLVAGTFPLEELATLGPDAVVPDFTDTAGVRTLLAG
ncbi:MAG TPA: haloacid dehalogenase-like hydrolase [Acidimicrobiales bacterium]|nr:haloacid dehalogenase-like hydrolase [Acidimicrobiales bacterium]